MNFDKAFSTVATLDWFHLTIFLDADDCIVYNRPGEEIMEEVYFKNFAQAFTRQLEKKDIVTYKIIMLPNEIVTAQGKINEINSEEAFTKTLKEAMIKGREDLEDIQYYEGCD